MVKIEKEAVLRKMKEQQKTSCSCTVCGRKRVAIEEELEVLYDAYYEELESYANHQQITSEDRSPIMPLRRGIHLQYPVGFGIGNLSQIDEYKRCLMGKMTMTKKSTVMKTTRITATMSL